MEIVAFIAIAAIVILAGLFAWALSRAPEGDEVEGVGFVRKERKP